MTRALPFRLFVHDLARQCPVNPDRSIGTISASADAAVAAFPASLFVSQIGKRGPYAGGGARGLFSSFENGDGEGTKPSHSSSEELSRVQ